MGPGGSSGRRQQPETGEAKLVGGSNLRVGMKSVHSKAMYEKKWELVDHLKKLRRALEARRAAQAVAGGGSLLQRAS